MTEAKLPITQSVVEEFTESYLLACGCNIQKDGTRWEVSVPEDSGTALSTGDFALLCDPEASDLEDGVEALYPSSSFFQNLLTEASAKAPTGRLEIRAEDADIEIPAWLTNGPLDVESAEFTPYYDRSAAVVLFQVSIETVSEYEQEYLYAIGVDAATTERLPVLENTFLQLTNLSTDVRTNDLRFGDDEIESVLDHAREEVLDQADDKIEEIHHEASRAADAELEEYRQLQEQHLDELEREVAALREKIDALRSSIQDSDDQEARVERLKERQSLKAELEETESELESLRKRRDQGFPDQQRQIRERHSLEVVITPRTFTQIEYERGEIDFQIRDQRGIETLSTGYGSGIGVTEEIICDECDSPLSDQNPLHSVNPQLLCAKCHSNPTSS